MRAFVVVRPPVPIVFTSRSEPASLRAAADAGEEFVYPGRPLWQANQGRLRILHPDGNVRELSWGARLPDGGALIDVMSPSVSPDGTKVVFAGRKGPPDHGHFRLYEVGIDGAGLRQLTGGPDDSGCTAVPPMRYRDASGKDLIPDDERRRIDFDDVDPIYLNSGDGTIAFISSRAPDLGHGHARRSTALWLMTPDGVKQALTANRHNDRWPFLLPSNVIAFSSWSRNQEAVTEDYGDIKFLETGERSRSSPPDTWTAAYVRPGDRQFGSLVKIGVPAWRPRPLFNGQIAFMTSFENREPANPRLRRPRVESPVLSMLQAAPGLMTRSPTNAYTMLPTSVEGSCSEGPSGDGGNQALEGATPSACPDRHVVFAGRFRSPKDEPDPRRYGIYVCRDSWFTSDGVPLTAPQVDLRLLFDDPDFVDAEPVAVYRRWISGATEGPIAEVALPPLLRLDSGAEYRGPAGWLEGTKLFESRNQNAPGQTTVDGQGPAFAGPPPGLIDRIRVYTSRRDRFDDPQNERVPGGCELVAKAPVTGGGFKLALPADVPLFVAGFTKDDRVASWETIVSQPGDVAPTLYRFLAYCGDHYVIAPPGGKQTCLGCHPGHSGADQIDLRQRERVK